MLLTAHSGFDQTIPNTWPSIRHALELRVDCLEVDVRLYENNLILSHDLPQTSAQDYVPLKKVFSALKTTNEIKGPSPILINCDLKTPEVYPKLIELAEIYQVQPWLHLSGEVQPAIDPINKSNDNQNAEPNTITRYFNLENYTNVRVKNFTDTLWIESFSKGFNHINIDYRCCTDAIADICRSLDIKLSLWTIDSKTDLLNILQKNWPIANITTRNWSEFNALRNEKPELFR